MARRAEVDPRFPRRLRELRAAAGLSLRDLERPTLASKSHLHALETGRARPTVDTVARLDDALDARGELVALVHGSTSTVLAVREPVDDLGPAGDRPSGQIGDGLVDQLLARTARLRRLDDYLGGADTYRLFAAEVDATAALARDGSFTETAQRRLLSVLAEQAQLAGWAAFDTGWHARAEELYRMSHAAGVDAGDTAVTGNALAFLAYLALAQGRSGVEPAGAACMTAGRAATPAVRALLLDRRAWAHAVEGEAADAERYLELAAAALAEHADRPEPDWVYWVDRAEVQIMTGRCWSTLRRPVRAISVLEDVLAGYDDTHGRDKALYLTWLADAYLDANEVEQACTVMMRAMDLSTGVGSVRPRQRVQAVIQRLDGALPVVAEVRARAMDWVSRRRLPAAPSPGTGSTPRPPALR